MILTTQGFDLVNRKTQITTMTTLFIMTTHWKEDLDNKTHFLLIYNGNVLVLCPSKKKPYWMVANDKNLYYILVKCNLQKSCNLKRITAISC